MPKACQGQREIISTLALVTAKSQRDCSREPARGLADTTVSSSREQARGYNAAKLRPDSNLDRRSPPPYPARHEAPPAANGCHVELVETSRLCRPYRGHCVFRHRLGRNRNNRSQSARQESSARRHAAGRLRCQRKKIATGTGFLVSSDGKLITNHHVIENGAKVVAKAENGGTFPILGVLRDNIEDDLALLKIDGKKLPCLGLGTSEKIEVGARVAVVGSPLGLEGSLSEGIVSAIREFPGKVRLLQITAAISPGSSGSPVLNANGEVVGVAVSQAHEGQSLNFAVPVEAANHLLVRGGQTDLAEPLSSLAKKKNLALSLDDIMQHAKWFGAVQRKELLEALTIIKELVARYPNNAELLANLGETYTDLTLYEDAVTAYQNAIKLAPSDTGLWLSLGQVYVKQGDAAAAMVVYQQAVRIWPECINAWQGLDWAYLSLGRDADAETAERQVQELKERAIGVNERAVRVNPENVIAWQLLKSAYEEQGNLEGYIAFCKEAVRENPEAEQPWVELQVALTLPSVRERLSQHLALDADDELHAFSREVVQLHPNSEQAWMWFTVHSLRTSNIRTRHRDEVIPFIKQFLAKNQDNHLAWFHLALSYRAQKDFPDAITALRKAITLKPDVMEWSNLAICYAETGQQQMVKESISELAKIDPQHAGLMEKRCKDILDSSKQMKKE